jgi:hypothetical protein
MHGELIHLSVDELDTQAEVPPPFQLQNILRRHEAAAAKAKAAAAKVMSLRRLYERLEG